MNYFGDLQFVGGGNHPDCSHSPIDNRFSQFYSLQYDRQGTIEFSVNHQPSVTINSPVLYLLHPDNHYKYGPVKTEKGPWHHSWLAFRGKRGRKIFEEGFMPLAPTWYCQIHIPIEFGKVFDEIITRGHSGLPSMHCQAVIQLESLLLLLQDRNHQSSLEDLHNSSIHKLATQIRNYPLTEWDFRLAAKRLGLSYSHFRKLFKMILGRAPHDFALLAKSNWAANEIKTSSKSIKEIANQCGYDDQAYFSKMFKKHLGLAPRYYRNSLKL